VSVSTNVMTLLHQQMANMTPSSQRVAREVLRDPLALQALTITEFAHACDTSAATVARFARTLGFDGYPQFRVAVASEALRTATDRERFQISESDVVIGDDARTTVGKIAYTEAAAIEQTARDLDVEVLDRVVDAIAAARRIDIYGTASSGLAGSDLQQKLHRAGLFAQAFTDQHLALTSAALLRSGDVAVAFSHSGRTLEIVQATRVARRAGATTVVVTNNAASPLAREADLVLTTSATESSFRSGAMSSRIAQLSIVDFVFVRLAQRDYDTLSENLRRTYDAVADHRIDGKEWRG
jgi:DNA-binding MurR/RpiR family transcriptional regulator